jgi:hypothetical protein
VNSFYYRRNTLSNNKQKGQSRKIIILLSHSVLLPERFFLKKLGIAPSVLLGIKLSRVLSGNGPFA